jgi:O-antigen chain-terminating methyltransferase
VRALRDQFGDEIGALRQQTAVLAPKVDQAVTAIAMQERRLTTLLEEVGKRRQEPLDRQQLQRFADELEHVSDAGYLNFEDAFRGSRDDIKQRVAVYLPKLRETSGPILDVGCGRGELLEVLRDAGLKASGVDSNAAAVELCRRAGLDVVQGDLFEVLARTPAGSLGGVTALHVVEHVPHALLLKLLDEVVRVLQPGGVAVFETPNPENVRVGATTFYLDPTHRNPVHPQTLRFLAEARGLSRVEMLPLHPCPDEMRIPEDTPVARRFNDYFYGPQDYAVLGRRP